MRNKMIKFKTAFMAVIVSAIWSQFNSVSKYIKIPDIIRHKIVT